MVACPKVASPLLAMIRFVVATMGWRSVATRTPYCAPPWRMNDGHAWFKQNLIKYCGETIGSNQLA